MKVKAKIKIKTVILIDGEVISLDTEGTELFETVDGSTREIVARLIENKYKKLRGGCKSDYEARLETAVQLNISEHTVRRYVEGY